MGEGESVKVHGVRVHVELGIGTQCHGVAEWIRIIDFLFHIQIARQRNRNSLPHEFRGFALTPTSPIRDLLKQFIELRLGVAFPRSAICLLRCDSWTGTAQDQ